MKLLHGHSGAAWQAAGIAAATSFALTSPAFAGDPAPGAEFIEITNVSELANQNVDISNQTFLAADQGGHFMIDTLEWDETIGRDAGGDVPGTGFREIAWWDVVIKVTRTPGTAGDVMISLDKDVTNNSGLRWFDFHMEVGTGVGSAFVTDPQDGLFFKTAPEPINELPATGAGVQAFDNPPMMTPDSLWWVANQQPGLGQGETTAFWFAINVPDALFVDGMAFITLREHASIPTPGALATLLAAAGVAAAPRRRRA